MATLILKTVIHEFRLLEYWLIFSIISRGRICFATVSKRPNGLQKGEKNRIT